MSQLKKSTVFVRGGIITLLLIILLVVLIMGESFTSLMNVADPSLPETVLGSPGDGIDPVESLYNDICGIGMTDCTIPSNTGLPSEPLIERSGELPSSPGGVGQYPSL